MNFSKLQICGTTGFKSLVGLSFTALNIEELKNDFSFISVINLPSLPISSFNLRNKSSPPTNIESSNNIESIAKETKRIVILGGGMGGIGVASKLIKNGVKNITIIEPNDYNYYQPLWSLVASGIKRNNETSKRPLSSLLPKNVNLVKAKAKLLIPENNRIELDNGEIITYDYLILAAGIQPDWDSIDGLKKYIEKDDTGILSVFDYCYSEKANKEIHNFKRGGNILFTVPNTTVKCIGCNNIWMIEEKLRNCDDKGNIFFKI
jgi:sulfide:quinone oxidoreductase